MGSDLFEHVCLRSCLTESLIPDVLVSASRAVRRPPHACIYIRCVHSSTCAFVYVFHIYVMPVLACARVECLYTYVFFVCASMPVNWPPRPHISRTGLFCVPNCLRQVVISRPGCDVFTRRAMFAVRCWATMRQLLQAHRHGIYDV